MSQPLKISIITIAFNSAETIEDTINSVISQDYPHIEYIVVDGKSTDGTVAIINKYTNSITKFISEKDKGLYDALNKGIKLSTGDIVGILHSDDLFFDNQVISKVEKAFSENNIDSLYANLIFVDRFNISNTKRVWRAGVYHKGAFRRGWMPPHPTFFVKTKLFQKLGFYRTDLRFSADYELMLRFIHKNNVSTYYLNEFIVKMRLGGISNTDILSKLKAHKEDKIAWQVNNMKSSTWWLWMKPLGKISQFFKRQ
ncbi:MAG: glycosyltransferase [Bacteroidetes bacterium]|nr:glycosyltransferase [Bacteroidota bacterium]